MKILFLDIDGVLCLHKKDAENWGAEDKFDRHCCRRLKEILDATGCKIVLSSFWRLNKQDIKNMLHQLRPFGITGSDFLGKTPLMKNRGDEISAFLSRRPEITTFIAVDDEAFTDGSFPRGRLVPTELDRGITEEAKNTIIEKLNQTPV